MGRSSGRRWPGIAPRSARHLEVDTAERVDRLAEAGEVEREVVADRHAEDARSVSAANTPGAVLAPVLSRVGPGRATGRGRTRRPCSPCCRRSSCRRTTWHPGVARDRQQRQRPVRRVDDHDHHRVGQEAALVAASPVAHQQEGVALASRGLVGQRHLVGRRVDDRGGVGADRPLALGRPGNGVAVAARGSTAATASGAAETSGPAPARPPSSARRPAPAARPRQPGRALGQRPPAGVSSRNGSAPTNQAASRPTPSQRTGRRPRPTVRRRTARPRPARPARSTKHRAQSTPAGARGDSNRTLEPRQEPPLQLARGAETELTFSRRPG